MVDQGVDILVCLLSPEESVILLVFLQDVVELIGLIVLLAGLDVSEARIEVWGLLLHHLELLVKRLGTSGEVIAHHIDVSVELV